MEAVSDELRTLHLSAADFDDRSRVEAFRETFGRAILQIDMEPLDTDDLHADMTLRGFSGLGMACGSLSPVRSRHLAALSDNDDPVLVLMQDGLATLERAGRTTEVRTGQAVLTVNGAAATFTGRTATRVVNLRLNRDLLGLRGGVLDEVLRAPLLGDSPALRLLRQYTASLNDCDTIGTPQLRQSVSAHIHELAALAITALRPAGEFAARAGVRAARLRVIKSDIVAEIGSHGLTLDLIARRHRISPRYVRKLFEGEQTSFSEFVLEQRLARARQMLTNPIHAPRMISAIAFDCGFGDLSYFNRTFRRRFGATPSDVRATAQRES